MSAKAGSGEGSQSPDRRKQRGQRPATASEPADINVIDLSAAREPRRPSGLDGTERGRAKIASVMPE